MIWLLTVVQIACFQLCALPAIVRMCRRHSSHDLSIWREVLIGIGVISQLVVMALTHTDWRVRLSPIASGLNVLLVAIVIVRHRE